MSLNWEKNWHFVGDEMIIIKRIYKIGDIIKSLTLQGIVGQHWEICTREKNVKGFYKEA